MGKKTNTDAPLRRKSPITPVGGARRASRVSATRLGKDVEKREAGKTKKANKRKQARSESFVAGRGLPEVFLSGAVADKRFGIGVMLAVMERQGDTGDIQYARVERFSAKPAQRPKTTLLAKANAAQLAKLLTGLAHADRIRIARAVTTGANTHRQLSETVGLKTGPLYHHVRELERAGLLTLLSRNTYGLTDLGRLTLMITTILGTWQAEGRSPWRTRRFGSRRR
ncbi:MAG: winged helix-turn-helix transcriptional regulator [Phycisphaerae bacterium]|nr:winged helix-turn-helix transcriptional regulator [Phycisphaerae bacterium]